MTHANFNLSGWAKSRPEQESATGTPTAKPEPPKHPLRAD